MTRDQGPKLHTRNGGARINTDLPQPTDGGDLTPFDRISEALFWAGTTALLVSLVSLAVSLTIFFFM